MRTVTNVGLIHYTDLATPFTVDSSNESNDYHIKKVLIKGHAAEAGHYPEAEIVQDAQSIIQDGSIDLVILLSPDEEGMNTVTDALSAGKNVRIL
jgi:predicted dehydrogenase